MNVGCTYICISYQCKIFLKINFDSVENLAYCTGLILNIYQNNIFKVLKQTYGVADAEERITQYKLLQFSKNKFTDNEKTHPLKLMQYNFHI